MDGTIRLEKWPDGVGFALVECRGVSARAAVTMLQRLLGARARIEEPGSYSFHRDGERVAVLKVVQT